jgi:hypothetical protein
VVTIGTMVDVKIYGIAEIGDAVGYPRQTVSAWYARGKLPPPDWILKMGPVWKAETIAPWIRRRKNDDERT